MFSKTAVTSLVFATAATLAHAFSGEASFYQPNGQFGACNKVIQSSDFSVAVPIDQFANGAVCGRSIEITSMNKSVIVTAQDECVTCSSTGSLVLDLTPAVFEVFANLNAGLIPITWNFV